MKRGLLLAAIQVLLVLSLAGKFLLDRQTRPRMWLQAAPYDPNMPIRGRYVRLSVHLPATPLETTPIVYFIPEHAPDPSVRAPGEQLWVEVTLPAKGPPRPIRLGVKNGEGPIVPLHLN